MKKIINLVALLTLMSGSILTIYSQKNKSESKKAESGDKSSVASVNKTDEDARNMVEAMFKAHGGENLKKIKNLAISGEADISSSDSVAPIKGSFAIVIDGNKGRFQIKTAFFAYTQIYDDETIETSIDGIYLPPISQFGFAVIPHIKEATINFEVNDKEKKDVDFYVTVPSGYTTAFKVDPKTNLAKQYSSTFVYNGTSNTTIVEIEKYKEIDGFLVPEKFMQKFDFRQMIFYVKYNAKTIETNITISPDIFTLDTK